MELAITTLKGLEPFLAEELKALGAQDLVIGARVVTCFGDKELLYRANYELRTALRVLIPIHNFRARDPEMLYRRIRAYNFSGYLSEGKTFAIDVAVNSEYFTHSRFAMHKVKDGIVDQLRQKYGYRPSIDVERPDFRLHVRISGDEVTLSSDSSGDSLHRRGYRVNALIAPVSEVLAAGLISMSGWSGMTTFIDPMAGSGTIAIEAAMYASNTPAQYCRSDFQFFRWRNFDKNLWKKIVQTANAQINLDLPVIFASDKDKSAIEAIKENVSQLPFADKVISSQFDFFSVRQENATIVFNPPYDERIPLQNALQFYEDIGTHLKHKCTGSNAWILSSNFQAMKSIGLKTSKRYTVFNGPLECKFYGYELFKGKKVEQTSNNT